MNDGIIPRLVGLLKSNHDEVRRNACFAVSVLCAEQNIAIEILRNGYKRCYFLLLIFRIFNSQSIGSCT
jgi:hypothetical protein